MIRVALLVQSRPLREELHALMRTSNRLRPVRHADAQADFASLETIDAIVCDDSQFEIARHAHEAGVAVVLLMDETDLAASPLERGAGVAWLPTSAGTDQIVAAIEAASLGLFVAHADFLSEDEIPPRAAIDDLSPEPLTPRELEVLLALAAGLGNKAIATRLGISEHTVKFHVSQVIAKLQVGSRAEAVSVGLRRGLLPL